MSAFTELEVEVKLSMAVTVSVSQTTTISNLILNAQSAVFITHCLGEQCHEHVLIMHKMLMTLVCKNCIT